jgi:hypothetical protein
MKAFVTYERDGELVSFIVGPSDGPPAAPIVEPGLHGVELDAPKTLAQLIRNDEGDEEKVIKALSAYRVDVKTEAKLVRKSRPSGKK